MIQGTSEPAEAFDTSPDSRFPRALLDAARRWTRGRRALFISNRKDPELHDRLLALLELESLDWTTAEDSRRIGSAAERVGAGTYHIVLGATGFIDHKVEDRISAACRRAAVPYVRVDRGRPLGCLRAIAEQLGESEPAGEARVEP